MKCGVFFVHLDLLYEGGFGAQSMNQMRAISMSRAECLFIPSPKTSTAWPNTFASTYLIYEGSCAVLAEAWTHGQGFFRKFSRRAVTFSNITLLGRRTPRAQHVYGYRGWPDFRHHSQFMAVAGKPEYSAQRSPFW